LSCDLLIRNARVFPGDAPPINADVAVTGDRISAVGYSLAGNGAREVIDAEGLMLCPGFIDMHAHSALVPFDDPRLLPKLGQGFTTELLHPDGLAPAPVDPKRLEDRREYLRALEGEGPASWPWSTLAEYLDALEQTHPGTSLVPSIGHGAVRDRVMAAERRPPSASELAAMRDEIRIGFEQGARSLSFGLIYVPGLFAEFDELVACAEEAASFGAPLVPHVRNEGDNVLEAVGEMIEVARRSGASLHLSHLKVIGRADLVDPLLELIDRSSVDLDLSFDQYPYGAGSTLLSALLPPWAQEGGARGILARLTASHERTAIACDMRRGISGWENLYAACGPERIAIANAASSRDEAIGQTLAELGEALGIDPLNAALDLLVDTRLNATMVDHYATEATVRTIFSHPLALVGSDGIFGSHPHPRLYGTAARVLGRYALRDGLIAVEDAVARLTARAAERLGLRDRGRIAKGLRADLVLIDSKLFIDTATFAEPVSPPLGLCRVVVGGRTAWLNGEPQDARGGEVVREALSRTVRA